MRLILTSDLHHNHHRSKPLAEDLIEKINRSGGDVLVLIGDTAVLADGALEACLSRFRFNGVKLFIPGNHELWTRGDDSYELFTRVLPERVAAMGWQWLQSNPFITQEIAIVGSVGWYDYSFAQENLRIPRRFYEAKISPGAAERFDEYASLLQPADDIPPRGARGDGAVE